MLEYGKNIAVVNMYLYIEDYIRDHAYNLFNKDKHSKKYKTIKYLVLEIYVGFIVSFSHDLKI